MSLSQSPSPHPAGGGWSSPGLTTGSGSSTPHSGFLSPNPLGPSGISWAAAKAKSDEVRGYPSFSTRNNGFFSRSKRRISATLPSFRVSSRSPNGYIDKDDFGRDRPLSPGRGWRSCGFGRTMLRRRRLRLLIALILVLVGYFYFWTCKLVMASIMRILRGLTRIGSFPRALSTIIVWRRKQVCNHS